MKTIYKYEFAIKDQQPIYLPPNAKIVHVGLDPNGCPCIWAIVDADDAAFLRDDINFGRTVYVVGTGHALPGGEYVGSFRMDPFMWHVFLD